MNVIIDVNGSYTSSPAPWNTIPWAPPTGDHDVEVKPTGTDNEDAYLYASWAYTAR